MILWNPDFSLQFLKFLYEENFLIEFVVSQTPHQNQGRGKTKLNYLRIPKMGVQEKKIPVFTPSKIKPTKFFNKN